MADSLEPEAREKLSMFLMELHEDLDFLMKHSNLLIHDVELRAKLEKAWRKTEPRFDNAELYLRKGLRRGYLEKRGLVGDELYFKLAVYEREREAVRAKVEDEGKHRGHEGWWWHIGSRVFHGFGDIVDSILSSLGIPGVEAIGEFKDAYKVASGG